MLKVTVLVCSIVLAAIIAAWMMFGFRPTDPAMQMLRLFVALLSVCGVFFTAFCLDRVISSREQY